MIGDAFILKIGNSLHLGSRFQSKSADKEHQNSAKKEHGGHYQIKTMIVFHPIQVCEDYVACDKKKNKRSYVIPSFMKSSRRQLSDQTLYREKGKAEKAR